MSNLKGIVSISGISGLKKVVSQRADGLIVSDLDGANKKFMASRNNLFSPLENISIYTDDGESVLLSIVFDAMHAKIKEVPLINPNSDNSALKSYLLQILPNYDKDKVNISDIKKLLKWYTILDELGLIEAVSEDKVDDGDGK
jgi:hypothetical protein